MSTREKHQRLLQNAYYAGVYSQLNVNNSFEENVRAFSDFYPYYDATTHTPPLFSLDNSDWEGMWEYLSERSYGLQYKTLILNAHYAGTLAHMNPNDVLKGDWEALAGASALPVAPTTYADVRGEE